MTLLRQVAASSIRRWVFHRIPCPFLLRLGGWPNQSATACFLQVVGLAARQPGRRDPGGFQILRDDKQPPLRSGKGLSEVVSPLPLAVFGCCLFLWRLGDPQRLNFDESYYVPAARALIDLSHAANIEHPPLGKLLIGLSMSLFGDHPAGWRVASACFGAIALYATIMLTITVSGSVRTGMLAGIFALTNQLLFVMARVAMLDIFLAAFVMLALWMLLSALQHRQINPLRVALAGIFYGLAAASKWSAIPILLASYICALAFVLGPMTTRDGRTGQPVAAATHPALRLTFWLLGLSAITYLATFLPMLFLKEGAIGIGEIIPFQFEILRLQRGTMASHPYQSVPWQWVLDLRPIWFFYEPIAGVYRGVLLVGNPVTMWGGLLALPVASVLGARKGNWLPLLVMVFYALSVTWWYASSKPVMFYHYYLLPGLLLCVPLAYVVSWALDRPAYRPLAWSVVAAAAIAFAYFYPILSAAPLSSPGDFALWMWFESWR